MEYLKSLLIVAISLTIFSCSKLKKDFRDDLTGKYKVKQDFHWFSMAQQSSYNYSSDTIISVDKGSQDSTFIVEPSDGNIRIGYGNVNNVTYQLYLQNDSIFFYRKTGGNGGGSSRVYEGHKIQ